MTNKKKYENLINLLHLKNDLRFETLSQADRDTINDIFDLQNHIATITILANNNTDIDDIYYHIIHQLMSYKTMMRVLRLDTDID